LFWVLFEIKRKAEKAKQEKIARDNKILEDRKSAKKKSKNKKETKDDSGEDDYNYDSKANQDDVDDDNEYYRQEIGQEPDPDTFTNRKRKGTKDEPDKSELKRIKKSLNFEDSIEKRKEDSDDANKHNDFKDKRAKKIVSFSKNTKSQNKKGSSNPNGKQQQQPVAKFFRLSKSKKNKTFQKK
jgi:hypothetical protein